MTRTAGSRTRVAATGLALLVAGGVQAQVPERFTNLQVLAKDISRKELVGTMRSFTSALGVRCGHCHEGGNPETLEGVDFASDAKWEKRTARLMARMVTALQENHLERLEPRPAVQGAASLPGVPVGCATCHRGLTRPESIDAVLNRTLAAGGADAVLRTYKDLRSKTLARGSYDFSQGPLNMLAERLLAAGRGPDAALILEMSTEFNPDAPWVHHLLGEARLASGDRPRALEAFERALALGPDNPVTRRKIEELKAPPPKP